MSARERNGRLPKWGLRNGRGFANGKAAAPNYKRRRPRAPRLNLGGGLRAFSRLAE